MEWITLRTKQFFVFESIAFDACIAQQGAYKYVLINEHQQNELSQSLMMVWLELQLYCGSSKMVVIARQAADKEPACLRYLQDAISCAEVLSVPDDWRPWVDTAYRALDEGVSPAIMDMSFMEGL